MGLPSKLKNMNLFLDGVGHLGVVSEVTPPKLAIKMEGWRGGGMLGEIDIDQGIDKLEAEFTLGGLMRSAIRQFGATQHDAVLMRFAGAYQDSGIGQVKVGEITCRGRYSEIDLGNSKAGGDTEHKAKLSCSYLKIDVDGANWLEIDKLAGVFRAAPGAVWNALKSVVMSGVAGVKNLLGIKSPSRLFMAMGGHITSGLAMGVERGGKHPMRSMARLATGMAGAGALAIAGPAMAKGGGRGAPASAGAAPITINIHQQPGEDADALAKRVLQLLEAKQRTARLSSYADDF